LAEGNTPLIPVPKIAKDLGGGFDLFVKFEGLNPTGSFKDRGMVAAVSEAVGKGAKTIMCASTGNTAASAAAYAARAGVKAIVLIPEGKVARGKLAAAAIYGARILQVDGSFDDALKLVREIAQKLPIALVNSVNPYRLEGQKTAAFELCDELGSAPDVLCIPVGNAGNITAYHMGFAQYDKGMPTFIGVQAEGAAPLVLGKVVEKPETIATKPRSRPGSDGSHKKYEWQNACGERCRDPYRTKSTRFRRHLGRAGIGRGVGRAHERITCGLGCAR
jgi:threonine synthase